VDEVEGGAEASGGVQRAEQHLPLHRKPRPEVGTVRVVSMTHSPTQEDGSVCPCPPWSGEVESGTRSQSERSKGARARQREEARGPVSALSTVAGETSIA